LFFFNLSLYKCSWLKSVNSLLERLDGQVENVVEERAANQEDSDILEGGIFDSTSSSLAGVTLTKKDTVLENILAKRGLSIVEDDDDDDDDDEGIPQLQEETTKPEAQELENVVDESVVNIDGLGTPKEEFAAEVITPPPAPDAIRLENDHPLQEEDQLHEVDIDQQAEELTTTEDQQPLTINNQDDSVVDNVVEVQTSNEPIDTSTADVVQLPIIQTPLKEERKLQTPSSKADEVDVSISGLDYNEYKAALAQARDAQKEARTLRRHVVSLNSQLESAEAEMTAQRNELERAAERMEKDRIRNKEEREKEKARHAEEVKQMKQQHENSLAEHKKRFEQQLEDARQHLRQVEERRMQEGGDWNKELANALEREKEMVRLVAALE
jgi:hypothetical protein